MLLLILLYASATRADAPFWKAKEKLFERVKAGEVIVAVNTKPAEANLPRRLTIVGGGFVRAPRDYTFNFARQFDRVAKLSGYVEKTEFHDDDLRVTIKALGLRATVKIKVDVNAEKRILNLTLIGGPLDGLKAELQCTEVDPKRTEVSINGAYAYENVAKGAALSLGLEDVFKKMAQRLRDEVERSFKAVDKPAAGVKVSGA